MGRSSFFLRHSEQQPKEETKSFVSSGGESMRRLPVSSCEDDACGRLNSSNFLCGRGTSSWAASLEAETEESSSSSSQSDNESPNTVMWGARGPNATAATKKLGGTATAPSRSIPVRRRRTPDPDQEYVDEMTRLYDLRTWEMYMRITEARKKTSSPAVAASISQHTSRTSRMAPTVGGRDDAPVTSTETKEETQEDETDPELFFEDLDDWY